MSPIATDRKRILVKTSTGWQDIAVQGPPGAPGQNVLAQAAGGELRGSYPDPTLKPREGAGRVVSTSGGGFSSNYTAANLPVVLNSAQGVPMRLGPFTPSVACWWPVNGMTLVRVLDSAWYIANVSLYLNVVDAGGIQEQTVVPVHNVALPYVSASVSASFMLAAGVSYSVDLRFAYFNAGTWQYHNAPQHTWISSAGVLPR